MRGLESRRKVLDYKSDNESVRQEINQKLGNRSDALRPENIDYNTIQAELNQLLEDERDIVQPEADVRTDSIDERSAKLDLLKKFGLFSEQEAGKATIYSSLDEKESADKFELDTKASLKEIQENMDMLADL